MGGAPATAAYCAEPQHPVVAAATQVERDTTRKRYFEKLRPDGVTHERNLENACVAAHVIPIACVFPISACAAGVQKWAGEIGAGKEELAGWVTVVLSLLACLITLKYPSYAEDEDPERVRRCSD